MMVFKLGSDNVFKLLFFMMNNKLFIQQADFLIEFISFYVTGKNLYNNEHVAIKMVSKIP